MGTLQKSSQGFNVSENCYNSQSPSARRPALLAAISYQLSPIGYSFSPTAQGACRIIAVLTKIGLVRQGCTRHRKQTPCATFLCVLCISVCIRPAHAAAQRAESAHYRPRMRVPLRFRQITGKPSGAATRSPRRDRAAIERSHCIDRLADHIDQLRRINDPTPIAIAHQYIARNR